MGNMKSRFTCFLLGFLQILSVQLCAIDAQSSEEPKKHMAGIYWTGPFEKTKLAQFDQNLQRNTYLSGVYIDIRWNEFEPANGTFDFSRIDSFIKSAGRNHKFYKLALMPGAMTPSFVYEAEAKSVTIKVINPNRSNYGQELHAPLPWDPIYQEYFFRALEQISQRYKDDPNFISVAITIANLQSPEWSPDAGKQNASQWKQDPDYAEKLKQCWILAIDQFAKLFPKQQLCLEASGSPLGLDQVADEIIRYGIAKYPDRFTIQTNQLMGRKDLSGAAPFQRILKYKNQVHHGFQNLAGWTSAANAARQGTMEMTAYNFVLADSEYLEVWHGDGMNTETLRRLASVLTEAQNLGPQKYREKLLAEGKYLRPEDDHWNPYISTGRRKLQ
jgi:hypothetical protein